MPRILLIDNYDSFTYNLLHYLCELGADVEVLRNDALSAADAAARKPDGFLISPGPATPDDAGISLALVRQAADAEIPLLGVCLGHQAIGQAFGGRIVRVPPMHGKVSAIRHGGGGVFKALPSPFEATRYHSLVVERETLPACLRVTAETDEGLIMGLEHDTFPLHGVQFHPESIASGQGHALLRNFLDLVR